MTRRTSPSARRRSSGSNPPLRVLVTNDDGVDAPGLDALVEALAAAGELHVDVVAPATNQTGAGSSLSMTAIEVRRATTASGRPAFAVAGTPVDAVLLALHVLLDARPDLVVAGVNAGPNLADFVAVSGTVSAARAAAAEGIPAIAVSLGLASEMAYDQPARFVTDLARRYRTQAGFRRCLRAGDRPLVLNVNFPGGSPRGVRVVGLGRLTPVSGYALAPGAGDVRTFVPSVRMGDVSATDWTSTLRAPRTDLEAFNHGFASVTPLAADLGLPASLRGLRDLERGPTRTRPTARRA